MGASRALREAQTAIFTDPILAQDMQIFMRDCINPEILVNPPTLSALLVSRTIWSDFNTLALVNPGRVVSLASQPTATDCGDAYANIIGPRLPAQVASEQSRIAKIISPFVPAANANTILGTLLPASEGMIMTASGTAADAIQQRMMINMLNDTSQTLGQVMNDPTAVQNAAATAMASQSANSSYRVMAKLAAETLPMIRNAIDLVILSVFPIILIMVIIAGTKGGVVLKSYVMTMLWVQLWAPLYAIVNYVGTMTGAKSMTAALEGIDGVTVTNAAQLLNTSISGEAVVGLLTISVPIIALALVKGGEMAMTGVVSGLTGPAQHSADKAGQAAGAGNIGAGNVQWGNYSASNTSMNKHNSDYSYAGGAYETRDRGGVVQKQFGDGTTAVSTPQHNTPLSGQLAATAGRQAESLASSERAIGFSNMQASSQQATAAFNEMAKYEKDGGRRNTVASGTTTTEKGQYSNENGQSVTGTTGANFEKGESATNKGTSQFQVRGGGDVGAQKQAGRNAEAPPAEVAAGGGNVKPVSSQSSGRIGFNFGAAAAQIQSYDKAIQAASKAQDSTAMKQAVETKQSYVNDIAQQLGFTSQTSGGTQGSNGVSASLQGAASYLEQAQANFTRADKLAEASKIFKGTSANVGYDSLRSATATSGQEIITSLKAFDANKGNPAAQAAIIEGLVAKIGGAELGAKHGEKHLSGAPVLSTDDQLAKKDSENRANPAVQDRTGEKFKADRAMVPTAPVGQESVSKPGSLQKGEGYIGDTRDKNNAAKGELEKKAQSDQTIVQGRHGVTTPDTRNPDSQTLISTGTVAADNATNDALISVGKLIPNNLGGVPTGDQHAERIGFNRENPAASRPAAPSQTPSANRPIAPDNWQGPSRLTGTGK